MKKGTTHQKYQRRKKLTLLTNKMGKAMKRFSDLINIDQAIRTNIPKVSMYEKILMIRRNIPNEIINNMKKN